jgi:hypothetical protein
MDLTTKRGWDQYLPKAPGAQCPDPVIPTVPAVVAVTLNLASGGPGHPRVSGFFAPRTATVGPTTPVPALPTETVGLNEPPPVQYDLMTDLLDDDMFKVYSDMLRSETLRIQEWNPAKFGYLPMMTVAVLGVLNAESFCERVLSCVKLVVSDLHVSLKADEIRILVMIRMNHEFMEYMRASYPDTPLSEFKVADTYVRAHGGVHVLDDDEDED